MVETRRCLACAATPGLYVSEAFTSLEGVHYLSRRSPCLSCQGQPDMPAPDEAAILQACLGRRGLRSKRPEDRRAYYVWRMARYHGGADVTMPMMASLGVRKDPWRVELEALAERLAVSVFGTHLAAAHRWGHALGRLDRTLPGLPPSAYPNGPVADADTPEEEIAELC